MDNSPPPHNDETCILEMKLYYIIWSRFNFVWRPELDVVLVRGREACEELMFVYPSGDMNLNIDNNTVSIHFTYFTSIYLHTYSSLWFFFLFFLF